jgi:large subunit ribosomal protein L2
MPLTNPITSSLRHLIRTRDHKNLKKKPTLKFKIVGLKQSSGKNNSGKITIFHKGGGHKRKYRKINFYRNNNSNAIVTSIEYDPNRSANIASVYDFEQKTYYYIIAPIDLTVGDIIKSGETLTEQKLGYSVPVRQIPTNSAIHNISLKKNGPSKLSRSAGAYSFILEKNSINCLIYLSSGKKITIPSDCYATLGVVSNDLHLLSQIGKAGRSRWLNIRPSVRGVAMNPIDHPNGGGEGKKSGKKYSPWGKPKKKKSRNNESIKMERSFY